MHEQSEANPIAGHSTTFSVGDYVSEQRSVGNTKYALVLSSAPITLASGLSGVTFRDLRSGEMGGQLGWLWQRLDSGSY